MFSIAFTSLRRFGVHPASHSPLRRTSCQYAANTSLLKTKELRRQRGDGLCNSGFDSRQLTTKGAAAQRLLLNHRRSCLDLPVLAAVVSCVAADGVRDHDGIADAEVVVEPLRVGRADVDTAVADVALTLVGHRPRRAVYEVAAGVELDRQLDMHVGAVG